MVLNCSDLAVRPCSFPAYFAIVKAPCHGACLSLSLAICDDARESQNLGSTYLRRAFDSLRREFAFVVDCWGLVDKPALLYLLELYL